MLTKVVPPGETQLTFNTFRALALAWTVARYDNSINSLFDASAKASELVAKTARNEEEIELRLCAEAAADYFGNWANNPSLAARAAEHAIEAASGGALFQKSSIITQLLAEASLDAERLESGRSPRSIAGRKLWDRGHPRWFDESWNQLSSKLLRADRHWQVWIDWYGSRVAGRPTGRMPEHAAAAADRAIGTILAESFDGSVADTNREIGRAIASAVDKDDEGGGTGASFFPGQFADVEPQTREAQSFRNAQGAVVDLDQTAGAAAALRDADSLDRHAEVLRLARQLIANYDREGVGANAAKILVDKVELLVEALGTSVDELRPGLLIPRGEALRQFRDTQSKRDIDSDAPVVSDSLLEALKVVVAAYNVFVSLDPELAARDEATLGPEARRYLISPDEGRDVVASARQVGAATTAAENALSEERAIAPGTPNPADRNSRRYSEGVKNLARAILSNAHTFAASVWANKTKVLAASSTLAVGLLAAAKWALANEAWLLRVFSANPAMAETIRGILEFLKSLPLL